MYNMKGEFFTMIYFNTIENAEKTCFELNDMQKLGTKLKCHIHPESCGDREILKQTIFKSIFRNIAPMPGLGNYLSQAELLKSQLEKTNVFGKKKPETSEKKPSHKEEKLSGTDVKIPTQQNPQHKEASGLGRDENPQKGSDKDRPSKDKAGYPRKWDPPNISTATRPHISNMSIEPPIPQQTNNHKHGQPTMDFPNYNPKPPTLVPPTHENPNINAFKPQLGIPNAPKSEIPQKPIADKRSQFEDPSVLIQDAINNTIIENNRLKSQTIQKPQTEAPKKLPLPAVEDVVILPPPLPLPPTPGNDSELDKKESSGKNSKSKFLKEFQNPSTNPSTNPAKDPPKKLEETERFRPKKLYKDAPDHEDPDHRQTRHSNNKDYHDKSQNKDKYREEPVREEKSDKTRGVKDYHHYRESGDPKKSAGKKSERFIEEDGLYLGGKYAKGKSSHYEDGRHYSGSRSFDRKKHKERSRSRSRSFSRGRANAKKRHYKEEFDGREGNYPDKSGAPYMNHYGGPSKGYYDSYKEEDKKYSSKRRTLSNSIERPPKKDARRSRSRSNSRVSRSRSRSFPRSGHHSGVAGHKKYQDGKASNAAKEKHQYDSYKDHSSDEENLRKKDYHAKKYGSDYYDTGSRNYKPS